MDGVEFRKHGRDMVDYIVDYLDNIDSRRVTPNTEPGYLQNLIPSEPPNEPEEWDTIMDDVEKKIMIGVMTTLMNIYFYLFRLLFMNIYSSTHNLQEMKPCDISFGLTDLKF